MGYLDFLFSHAVGLAALMPEDCRGVGGNVSSHEGSTRPWGHCCRQSWQLAAGTWTVAAGRFNAVTVNELYKF